MLLLVGQGEECKEWRRREKLKGAEIEGIMFS